MLNQVILLGRIDTIGNDTITINNNDILYAITFTGDNILQNVKEYCKIGDLIGIKAKLIENNVILAEKVTFLSSK